MSTLIASLLRSGGPATIAGFVITVVVDAINRSARRLLTHVLKERHKAEPPSIAHGDAASAVEPPVLSVWIRASSDHCRPRGIRGRPESAGLVVAVIGSGTRHQCGHSVMPQSGIVRSAETASMNRFCALVDGAGSSRPVVEIAPSARHRLAVATVNRTCWRTVKLASHRNLHSGAVPPAVLSGAGAFAWVNSTMLEACH